RAERRPPPATPFGSRSAAGSACRAVSAARDIVIRPGGMTEPAGSAGPPAPPPGFPSWRRPPAHDPGPPPRECPPRQTPPPGSRPPHLPSFTYLGRAERAPSVGGIAVPRYVLHFRVPEVESGAYKYVLFCGSCYSGPGGVIIESAVISHGRLGPGTLVVER